MKKLIISLLFCLFLTPLAAFSNNNFIYSINVSSDDVLTNGIKLEIKSDYRTDIKSKIDEMGREYFDIKDASLKENFAVRYNNVNGVESVIAQQIGNKVRIYVTGNGISDVDLVFNNVENQPYPDKSAGYALLVFGVVICALFRIFKRKAKRFKIKTLKANTPSVQNPSSKAVYNNLMDKNGRLQGIRDNRNLTVNAKNIRTIQEHQRMYAARTKVAM